MSKNAEQRKVSAEKKVSSAINTSQSKALYSFSKSERFPERNYRSLTNVRFYDVGVKMYDKKVGFTKSKRTDLAKKDGVPGPTRYCLSEQSVNKNIGIQFKSGREQCKANSIFKESLTPSPAYYNPQVSNFKNVHFSLGKRLNTIDHQGLNVPGPIYNIESTMLDKNKNLSIYVRRNSTKICPSRTCYPRKTKHSLVDIESKFKSSSETSFITCKGGKNLGQSGPFPRQSQSKRSFQKDAKSQNPGPGYYESFSSFIDDNVQVL